MRVPQRAFKRLLLRRKRPVRAIERRVRLYLGYGFLEQVRDCLARLRGVVNARQLARIQLRVGSVELHLQAGRQNALVYLNSRHAILSLWTKLKILAGSFYRCCVVFWVWNTFNRYLDHRISLKDTEDVIRLKVSPGWII